MARGLLVNCGTWRNTIRTDYIGHEIDRLFRAAKAARPMLVTVGQNLWGIADPDAPRFPMAALSTGPSWFVATPAATPHLAA